MKLSLLKSLAYAPPSLFLIDRSAEAWGLPLAMGLVHCSFISLTPSQRTCSAWWWSSRRANKVKGSEAFYNGVIVHCLYCCHRTRCIDGPSGIQTHDPNVVSTMLDQLSHTWPPSTECELLNIFNHLVSHWSKNSHTIFSLTWMKFPF